MIQPAQRFDPDHGPQRLRSVQDRHRTVEFTHRRPDDRRRPVRPRTGRRTGLLDSTERVTVELFGSLGATGKGHGSIPAVALGLMGERPDAVDPDRTPERIAAITDTGQLSLLGEHPIAFSLADDIILHTTKKARFHSNAMVFRAFDHSGAVVAERTFYSIGGGFVVDDTQVSDRRRPRRGRRPDARAVPVPHRRRAAGRTPPRPACASATS